MLPTEPPEDNSLMSGPLPISPWLALPVAGAIKNLSPGCEIPARMTANLGHEHGNENENGNENEHENENEYETETEAEIKHEMENGN